MRGGGEARVALPARVSTTALRRCDPRRAVRTLAGTALGTTWRVRFAAMGDEAPPRLRAAITDRLAGIVAQMSQWEPTSLLSRFNRSPAGAWYELPDDFAAVLQAARMVAQASGGAFDPTHGRAAALLGFGAEPAPGAVAPEQLEEALAHAGWQRLAFEPSVRRLRQPGGLWLDFSGVAKGYAVDAIAEVVAVRGMKDVLVEIGGELVGRGLRPDGQPWWVELETPSGAALPPLRVALHDAAVATSGDYVRGAHTLDPRTGRPLPPGVAAVSVVHESAMLADAWATALTVLGTKAAMAVAEREGIAARMVARDGEGGFAEHLTPALRAMIED